jgi:uncharacterized protein
VHLDRLGAVSVLLLICGCSEAPADRAAAERYARLGSPKLTGRVMDGANLLSAPTEAALTRRLAGLEARTTDQIVVVTLADLEGKPIEEWGVGLGRGWRIGQAEKDNGLLLIIAPQERKVRIEVGYGLEASVRDEEAKQIIASDILPHFRQQQFEAGIEAGVDALFAELEKTSTLKAKESV